MAYDHTSVVLGSIAPLAPGYGAPLQDTAERAQRRLTAIGYPSSTFSFVLPALGEHREQLFAFVGDGEGMVSIEPCDMASIDALHGRVYPLHWADAATQGDAGHHAAIAGVSLPLYGPFGARAVLQLPAGDGDCPRIASALLHAAAVFQEVLDLLRPAAPLRRARLTERQQLVLGAVAQGKAVKQIANELGIGITTVRYLLNRCIEKLGVDSREQAIVRAMETGQIARA